LFRDCYHGRSVFRRESPIPPGRPARNSGNAFRAGGSAFVFQFRDPQPQRGFGLAQCARGFPEPGQRPSSPFQSRAAVLGERECDTRVQHLEVVVEQFAVPVGQRARTVRAYWSRAQPWSRLLGGDPVAPASDRARPLARRCTGPDHLVRLDLQRDGPAATSGRVARRNSCASSGSCRTPLGPRRRVK
jgi:hypothetical protein